DRFLHPVRIETCEKQQKMVPDLDAGVEARTRLVPVDPDDAMRSTLTPGEIHTLVGLVLRIEQEMGQPADVEWCVAGGTMYLLQARPITQDFDDLEVFIDTNLSESYPGVSSPLGGDYIRTCYNFIYRKSARLIGVSGARMEPLGPFFDTLIENVGGHVYYTLRSYQNVLLAMPGGRKNIENWYRMIGGDVGIQFDYDPSVLPPKKEARRFIRVLLRHILFHDRIYRKVHRRLEAQLTGLNEKGRTLKGSKEIIKAIDEALGGIAGIEYTITNDIILMGGLGLISRLLKRHGYEDDLIPPLIKTQEGVESLRPLEGLEKLCAVIDDSGAFLTRFETVLSDNEDRAEREVYPILYQALKGDGLGRVAEEIEGFLDRFGSRSFEELKIESMTFGQSPREV
ncbi:MAG: PEP/pyruvate-binding domain-containing protein, partial [Verrucomicrobiota bacterium]